MKVQKEKSYQGLASSSRVVELRNSHRDYYVALAEQAETELRLPDQGAWRRLLDSEYDNIIQAFEWSLDQGSEHEALRLALALREILYYRGGLSSDGREWLERALALGVGSPSSLRAKALDSLSKALTYVDHKTGHSLARLALETTRSSGDRVTEAQILRRLASQFWHEEGPQAAIELGKESVESANSTGDELTIADTVFLSEPWLLVGKKPRYSDALDVYRSHGDQENIAWVLYSMGWAEEDVALAWSYAEESLAIGRELENDTLILCVIQLLGYLARSSGDYQRAHAIFEDALNEYRRPGRKWPVEWGVGWMLMELADIEIEEGDFDTARGRLEEYLAISRSRNHKRGMSNPLGYLGMIAAAEGDHSRALKLCEEAVALARDVGVPIELAERLELLGCVAMCLDEMAVARASYEESLAIRGQRKGAGTARTLTQFAHALIADGQHEQAKSHLERALDSCSNAFVFRTNAPRIEILLGRVARLTGDLLKSDSHSAAGTRTLHEFGHRPYLALGFEERAALAAAKQDFNNAARIYGAAEMLRESVNVPVPLHERKQYEAEVQALRAALDENSFRRAWEEGRLLTLENTLSIALDESGRTSRSI